MDEYKKIAIDIKVGQRCNNHCKFCIQEAKRLKGGDKTTSEIIKILEENCGSQRVIFTGGEITLRSDVFELVRRAKQLGYKKITIQSNGRMFFYKDFCQRIIDAGANQFALSIHGSTSKIHDNLTCAGGSFEQTLEGICNLKKFNQEVITNTVITKKNYKDLINVAKLVAEIKVNTFQLAFLHINSIIRKNLSLIEDLVPRYKDVKVDVEEALKVGIEAEIRSGVEAFPFCTLDEKYYDCIIEKYLLTPVYIFENDQKIDFKKMKKDGAKIKREECKQCKFYEKCEGPWCEYPEIFGFEEFEPIKYDF